MTQDDVLRLIADALAIDSGDLTPESTAGDFSDAWDSMGTMNILLALDSECSVTLAPGDAELLTSVAGVLSILKKSGKLS